MLKNNFTILLTIVTIIVVYIIILVIFPYVYAIKLQVTMAPENFGKQILTRKGEGQQPETNHPAFKIAVIGDSTAAGQGTDSIKESVAWQYTEKYILKKYPKVEYTSFAKVGSRVEDITPVQLEELLKNDYDLIFVSTGANNVTDFKSNNDSYNKSVQALTDKLVATKSKIIWLSIPDFITSPILLPPLNIFLSNRTREFNQQTTDILKKHNIKLVDTYNKAREPFARDQNKYFSKDKYHPSKDGYALWVEVINEDIKL